MQIVTTFKLKMKKSVKKLMFNLKVLSVAWEIKKMHSKYKKCGWKAKHFEPCVPSGNATMKKSKKPSQGLNPEQEQLISDTNV